MSSTAQTAQEGQPTTAPQSSSLPIMAAPAQEGQPTTVPQSPSLPILAAPAQEGQPMTAPQSSSLPILAAPSVQAHGQAIATPSSLPILAAPSVQTHGQAIATLTGINPSLNAPLPSFDGYLSDVPRSPVHPPAPPPSPVPSIRGGPRGAMGPPRPYCTHWDCPVREVVRRHHQGPYLHGGQPPRRAEPIFRSSNPPPHVWASLESVKATDFNGPEEDDLIVMWFLTFHARKSYITIRS